MLWLIRGKRYVFTNYDDKTKTYTGKLILKDGSEVYGHFNSSGQMHGECFVRSGLIERKGIWENDKLKQPISLKSAAFFDGREGCLSCGDRAPPRP